jgi:hypothetical protein
MESLPVQVDFTIPDDDRQAHQCLAATWAGNTETIMNSEQRGMRGALNMLPVETEKLLRDPVQRAAGMRALVVVGIQLAMFAHHEYIVHAPAITCSQATAAPFTNLIQPA